MTWLSQAIDGECSIRQLNSWEHLSFIADSNKVERSAMEFEQGTIEESDKSWGKPD